MNILLVEDHPDTAQALKRYLEFCGHSVVRAGTCEEALRHPDLARMEVLICDIGLPDCSGWDLLPELRAKTGCQLTKWMRIRVGKTPILAKVDANGGQSGCEQPVIWTKWLRLMSPAGLISSRPSERQAHGGTKRGYAC